MRTAPVFRLFLVRAVELLLRRDPGKLDSVGACRSLWIGLSVKSDVAYLHFAITSRANARACTISS